MDTEVLPMEQAPIEEAQQEQPANGAPVELTRDQHLERLQAENEAHEKRIRDVVKEMRKAQGRIDDQDRLQEESKLRAGLMPLRDDMPVDQWIRARTAQIENGIPSAFDNHQREPKITDEERLQAEAHLRQSGFSQQPAQQPLTPDPDVIEAAVNQRLHSQRMEQIKSEVADFDALEAKAQSIPIHPAVLNSIAAMDESAEITIHLARNPALAKELWKGPIEAGRTLERIRSDIEKAKEPVTTSAPRPATPLRKTSSTDNELRDDLSTEEWMRRRKAQVQKRREQ